jgi:outer membrane protein TolC
VAAAFVFAWAAATPLRAQQPPLTIGQAVELALGKYPAVRVSLEQTEAAAQGVNLARTAYLPRADFLAQVNRATRNNVFGLLLPQSVIPSMSGPVLGTNDLTNVWGTAAGVLVSWEPFDFGLRRANVEAASAVRQRSETDLAVTRLQVAAVAADAFLTLLAAQQTVTAAQAGVERALVLDQAVGAQARSGLRPGADAARAHAEFAFAQTQLIQAEQAVDVARAGLADILAVAPAQVALEPGPLLTQPKELPGSDGALVNHPLAQQQSAVVGEIKARERTLDSAYRPRFFLQGSVYGRGSGAHTDGTTGEAFSGLAPNVQNWALGMTVVFPAFDLPAIRARRQIDYHNEMSASAQYDRILQDLEGQLQKAQAMLAGSQRVAQYTPVQLEAARAAQQQAAARYKSGLGNIVEVADAQRLLTQAEIDDSLARLGVWRALLAVAAARGDLEPFLELARK